MPAPSTPARRLRRGTAGLSLIALMGVLIPQALVDPAGGGSGAVFYRAAAESRGALVTSLLLLMVSGVLTIPAASGVLHQTRDRGAALGNAGAALLVLGGFGHFGMGFFYLVAAALPGGDRDEMISFVDRLNESALLGAVAFPLILSFGLGAALLPWAAWRAGAVHWWLPVLATAAIVAEFGLPFRTTASVVAVLAALTVAYAALGSRVLRMTDAEWDGVRPSPRTEAPLPA